MNAPWRVEVDCNTVDEGPFVQVSTRGTERVFRVTIDVNPSMEERARAEISGKRRSCARLCGPDACRIA